MEIDFDRERAWVETIVFVETNAIDLSRFADRSFDLVLNMDGAIYEACRLTNRTLIVTVSNRVAMIPV